MSLLPPIARMLFAEHKRKSITGDILTVGRQSVPFSHRELATILLQCGIKPRKSGFVESDTETVGANPDHLTDRSFFSMFSDGTLRAVDVSDYEGAAIVHDLNEQLPGHLAGIADFVFDGSCLDNLFDPARALKSMSRMLRPGGRLFCFNHATPIQSAYLCFSPEWFWDFFEANGYRDIQVFTCEFASIMDDTWEIYSWLPGTGKPARDFIVVAIAEKRERSTDDRSPIQAHYRRLHGTA